jgi:hypothetical protein
MPKQRGAYARRNSEHDKDHAYDRAMEAEATEYRTAQIVGAACDEFLRKREKPIKQNDNRFRR